MQFLIVPPFPAEFINQIAYQATSSSIRAGLALLQIALKLPQSCV
jgi:hypothetical protein